MEGLFKGAEVMCRLSHGKIVKSIGWTLQVLANADTSAWPCQPPPSKRTTMRSSTSSPPTSTQRTPRYGTHQ